VTAGDRVLEVGAGSGYQAAVLAAMGCEVFSVEIVEPLAVAARDRLAELGYDNVYVVHGNGHEGWPEHAPYDAAIGTAAAEELPAALVEQLKTDGRLVLPIGTWSQSLYLIEKTESGPDERILLPVRFVPMTGG
jgi:protein-L-isoaspartate(D-aspartate) O-methyltransferase